MNAFGVSPGPAAEQMMQLVRRDGGGVRDRLDLGLVAPLFRDEGDRAANGVIVALRGIGRTRLGRAVIGHGKVHHHGIDVGPESHANHPISDSRAPNSVALVPIHTAFGGRQSTG